MALFQDDRDFVFLFPGIGVKPFGKEHQFFKHYRSILEPYLVKGSVAAGLDLRSSLLAGTVFENEQLAREIFAYVFSCGTFQVFLEKGLQPRLMAGHSLGIYAALSSAAAVSFDDGLKMIEKAHQLGRKYSGDNVFGVAVIIGLHHEDVLAQIRDEGHDSINLANLNSSTSCVYVGYREEVDTLLLWAEREGAIKTIRLRIDIPFHSPRFMQEATQDMRDFLVTLTWQKPLCPILSALDQTLIRQGEELIAMTANNLSCSINWPGLVHKLAEMGIKEVIECGAGLSLTQHSRFIDDAPRHYNLKNMRRRLNY